MSERAYTPAIGRSIIDANRYMTVATADADGRPWASPVWFAHRGYREFFWASRSSVRHSVNIESRPEVGIVVFDSTVLPDEGQAVYLQAVARQLPDDALEDAIAVYAAGLVAQGMAPWTAAKVSGAAPFRLYAALVQESYLLGTGDWREAVPLDT